MCLMRKPAKNGPELATASVPVLWLDSTLSMPEAVRISVLKASQVGTKFQRVHHLLRAEVLKHHQKPHLESSCPDLQSPAQIRDSQGRARYSGHGDVGWRAFRRGIPNRANLASRQWCFSQMPPIVATDSRADLNHARVLRFRRSASRAAATPKCDKANKSPLKGHLTVMFKYPLSSNLL